MHNVLSGRKRRRLGLISFAHRLHFPNLLVSMRSNHRLRAFSFVSEVLILASSMVLLLIKSILERRPTALSSPCGFVAIFKDFNLSDNSEILVWIASLISLFSFVFMFENLLILHLVGTISRYSYRINNNHLSPCLVRLLRGYWIQKITSWLMSSWVGLNWLQSRVWLICFCCFAHLQWEIN